MGQVKPKLEPILQVGFRDHIILAVKNSRIAPIIRHLNSKDRGGQKRLRAMRQDRLKPPKRKAFGRVFLIA